MWFSDWVHASGAGVGDVLLMFGGLVAGGCCFAAHTYHTKKAREVGHVLGGGGQN